VERIATVALTTLLLPRFLVAAAAAAAPHPAAVPQKEGPRQDYTHQPCGEEGGREGGRTYPKKGKEQQRHDQRKEASLHLLSTRSYFHLNPSLPLLPPAAAAAAAAVAVDATHYISPRKE